MTWELEIKELELRRQKALKLGGEERVARQHQQGRLTIRERIEAVLDRGSFTEVGQLAGDAEW
jgi:acetyl-CoA carboxylase carboxyltransferase component